MFLRKIKNFRCSLPVHESIFCFVLALQQFFQWHTLIHSYHSVYTDMQQYFQMWMLLLILEINTYFCMQNSNYLNCIQRFIRSFKWMIKFNQVCLGPGMYWTCSYSKGATHIGAHECSCFQLQDRSLKIYLTIHSTL